MRKTLLFLFICCTWACNVQRNVNNQIDVSALVMNKEWVVVEMEKENVDSLSMDQRPTIKFSKEMVSGSASCNRFHGTYNMEGNTLTFGQIATTKMYCQTTDNIEKTYLKALSDVRTWEYKQERLYFFNQEKKIIIIYKEL